MSAIFQALATGAAFLVPVVIVMILASIAAVNRAEAEARPHGAGHEGAPDGGAAAEARSRLPFLPDREPSVLEILILGVVLFTLVMGGLLVFSMLGQA